MEQGQKLRTFWEEIVDEAETEIESVCIGSYGWDTYANDDDSDGGYDSNSQCSIRRKMVPKNKTKILLSAHEASAYLSYPYDPSFGAAKCHAIYAWTKDHVLFVTTYDGSVSISRVPRNPISTGVSMFGQ